MPGREDTASRCVSVNHVPKELREDIKRTVVHQTGLSEGHISIEEVVGYHTEQNLARYVFLLDHKRSVDRLCDEIKTLTVEKDGKRVDLTYERSTECEIAEEWTKFVAPAEHAMDSAPKGPVVPPPRVPRRRPRPQMMESGFYQNVERPSGLPFGPAPGPEPMPLGTWQGVPRVPQAYLPQYFNLGSQGQGESGMHAQGYFCHQGQGQPRGQFPQMPVIPGYSPFVMGPRGPMLLPGFPMQQMPVEGDKPHGQDEGHYQFNQEFPNMPPGFFEPRMFPMFPPTTIAQQLNDDQAHSSPPCIPENTDDMDNIAEISQKFEAVEDPQVSEMKEATASPRSKGWYC